jgi:flagellar biosynthesis protein FliR
MSVQLEIAVFVVFVIFCRVGGCLLFAPGLSSARIPMQSRLLIAAGASIAIAPLLYDAVSSSLSTLAPAKRPYLVIAEVVIGSAIGLYGRMFILALQFGGAVIAGSIGLAGIPGVPIEDTETGSILSTLVSSAAVMIILAANLHTDMLRAIVDSYDVIPPGGVPTQQALVQNLVEVLRETWLLVLRMSAPFIVYGVVVNVAIGLVNRFVPHISVYHATTGAVMIGGFVLLHTLLPDWMNVFVDAYRNWLVNGGF